MNNFEKYFSKKPTYNDWKSDLEFTFLIMKISITTLLFLNID